MHVQQMCNLFCHSQRTCSIAIIIPSLLPAIIGVIPYAGIDLAVYEFLKTVRLICMKIIIFIVHEVMVWTLIL